MELALPLLLGLALASAPAGPPDAQFYLLANECKTVIGSLVEPTYPIKVVDGTPFLFACTRVSREVVCDMRSIDGAPGIKGTASRFSILVDSPPELMLATEHAADYITINLTQHTFVVIARAFADNFAGSKVCQGLYLTAFEMEQLQKNRGKK